jgi:D-tyrosyl-tRNA(Tyr) deacylase
MRVVLQRVSEASVSVDGEIVGQIGVGFLVLVGFGMNDTEEDLNVIVNKIIGLRVFPDDNHKMNLSILDVNGEILAVSQFTLYADCRKGRRPSFTEAAPPIKGLELFEQFIHMLKTTSVKKIATGTFQAMMKVQLVNDGPVTIYLDSKDLIKK